MQAITHTVFFRRKTSVPGKVLCPENFTAGQRRIKKTPRIRCPRCNWQPDGKPYWQCERCLTVFDTFQTGAHRPNRVCGNSWQDTQCILCGILSPHEKWYENDER
jgi:hypothetical protein